MQVNLNKRMLLWTVASTFGVGAIMVLAFENVVTEMLGGVLLAVGGWTLALWDKHRRD